jgi:hypothetical protein
MYDPINLTNPTATIDNIMTTLLNRECKQMTINDAIRFLYSMPRPSIRYKQLIDTRNIYQDLAYSSYLSYHEETLHIRFPPECVMITNIYNDRSYKMVYYKKEKDSLTEVVIHKHTIIDVTPDTSIIVYLRPFQRVKISFDLTLQKLLSKL